MEIKNKILSRFTFVYWSFFVFFLIVIAKVLFVIIFQKSFYKDFQRSYEIRKIEARRGDIIDINGRLLATTQTRYTISMDPRTDYLTDKVFYSKIDSLCNGLSRILKDKTANEYRKLIVDSRIKGKRDVQIVEDIDYFTFKQLQKLPIFNKGKIKGGFKFIKSHEPILLHSDLGRRIIGFENTKELFFGIQMQMNDILAGTQGNALMQNFGGGHYIEQTIIKKPIDGNDIVSTLDINLQDLTDKILRTQLKVLDAESGVVIIMEVKTGEIRAMVNLSRKSDSTYGEIKNLAVTSLYEPGSVMKLASMIIAFEKNPNLSINKVFSTGNGLWQVTKDFTIRDYNYKDGGFGNLTVQQIFENSSNIGVAKIIQSEFSSNPSEFVNRISQLYLDKRLNTGIDNEPLPQISKPNTPQWSGVSYMQIAYGYEISVTPLHLITLYNAIANDGKMVKPMFIKRIQKVGKTIEDFEPEVLVPSICSQRTLKIIQGLLNDVIVEGTGEADVKSDLVKIAGKSGTAQIYNKNGYETGNVEATFIAYFPSDKPKYTCLVWISKPQKDKSGSGAAGTVIKQLAEAIYAFDYDLHDKNYVLNNYKIGSTFPTIASGYSPYIESLLTFFNIKHSDAKYSWTDPQIDNNMIVFKSLNVKPNIMPNVKGMNARDAVYLLENIGLKVTIEGAGRVVEQSIEQGTQIKKNSKVKITLSI